WAHARHLACHCLDAAVAGSNLDAIAGSHAGTKDADSVGIDLGKGGDEVDHRLAGPGIIAHFEPGLVDVALGLARTIHGHDIHAATGELVVEWIGEVFLCRVHARRIEDGRLGAGSRCARNDAIDVLAVLEGYLVLAYHASLQRHHLGVGYLL